VAHVVGTDVVLIANGEASRSLILHKRCDPSCQ